LILDEPGLADNAQLLVVALAHARILVRSLPLRLRGAQSRKAWV
jgi:hypothetical protein